MGRGLLLSIDQGTSSTKACVYEAPGTRLGRADVPVARHTLADGSVVQDPAELVASCRDAARAALAQVGAGFADLTGVALANQGESFLLVDRLGNPLTPVISWLDSTVGDVIRHPAIRCNADEITRRTGLPLHPEFVAPRLSFQLEQLPDRGRGARLATLDTWLVHQLSDGAAFITDRATASRTMLIALDGDEWDEGLLSLFGIDREVMPSIVPCDRPGVELIFDGHEVPLTVSSFDMGLALLGHACLQLGDLKATFGTCLGIMVATGCEAIRADGLLSTIPYTRGPDRAMALDGEIPVAGALIDWAVQLGIASSGLELDRLAGSVESAGGVTLVPAIAGLGAPHWDSAARGSFTGLSTRTERAHLARAVYDAIGWSVRDVCQKLESAGVHTSQLRVDGGLTWSAQLMQTCADICQMPVRVSADSEATAFGGAALAMLVTGQIGESQLREVAARGCTFVDPLSDPGPAMAEAWSQAVEHAMDARTSFRWTGTRQT